MEWHVDDILFSNPQTEVVFTIENSSDCMTMWKRKPRSNHSNKKGSYDITEQVETEPNSAILIQAGGPMHKVSALRSGRRIILKFVFVEEGAEILDDARCDQFSNSNTSKRKKKKRKR